MMKISSNKRKFNTRPLTKSEKILLALLALVILLWASNRFVFKPQAAKMANLEAEKLDYEMKIVEINNTLKSEDKIKKEWEILQKEREQILSQYFPSLDQSQIIYLLNDLTNDDNFDADNYSFSRPSTIKLGEIDVRNMEASIPFVGEYDGIIDVINSFKSSPRKILVKNLSMDRRDGDEISGNLALNIYSLEGIAETDPNVIFVESVDNTETGLPFEAYDGFSSAGGQSSNGGHIDEDGNIIFSPDLKEGMRKELLHEFDYVNYSFIPSSPMVKGNVTSSTIRKSGKYSMRLEYNILALDDENRAYVDLSSSNIELKIPPDILGSWVYSYGYSPGTLAMRLVTQSGEFVDVTMVEGLTWMGWSYIETQLPADLNLYPLRLDKIFYELPYNRDDYGIILIDKMEAFYHLNEIESTSDNQEVYTFYVVEVGDNISEISRKMYGSISYKNEIMQLNDIKAGQVLPVGKVLVIRRH